MRVLVAEDDDNIRAGLCEILEREGYTTVPAKNGDEALVAYSKQPADFVCLDVMMPGKSGYDVCRALRLKDADVPIMFISAKGEEVDRVVGLELGADDFIVKPFGVSEVVARIRAISRRCLQRKASGPAAFVMKDLEVRPRELRARRGDELIELSLRDVKLLTVLYERRGEALDRDALFNAGWGIDHLPNSRTLDQHISQLRKRIEKNPREPDIIQTVHGVGYRFEP